MEVRLRGARFGGYPGASLDGVMEKPSKIMADLRGIHHFIGTILFSLVLLNSYVYTVIIITVIETVMFN